MDLLEPFPLKPANDCGDVCADDFLEHPIVFVERFWKWRDSLFVVACRVLGDARAATDAVEACFRAACKKPPKFESEGEFGSWLLRILLDEALHARRRSNGAPKGYSHQAFARTVHRLKLRPWLDDFWCLETTV